MKKASESFDLSYRPSHWVRLAAVATMGVALATTLPAGGNRERQADPDAERTRIETPGPESPDGANEATGTDAPPVRPGTTLEETDRPPWAIVFHPALEVLRDEINETIRNGYVPVGLEIGAGGDATALYRAVDGEIPRQWLLEDYTADSINDQLTARLLEGWSPLGFSVVDEVFFVLYGPAAIATDAWRIHESELNPEAIPTVIDAYRDESYTIVDFSIDPATDRLWYLFVRRDDGAGRSDTPLFVNAYPRGEQTAAGMSVDYMAGRGSPEGIASGDQISLVLFERE